jgi:hypothetical protein
MRNLTTMRIVRRTLLGLAGLGAAGWLSASVAAGGQAAGQAPHHMPMPDKGMMTKEQKIAGATTAAPASVSAKATILDWPAKEGAPPTVLRQGSNGWHCLPDMPESHGSDPMCVDLQWMKWIEAYATHKTPEISGVGIGYMIAPGGGWGSNTDPYAMAATPDNHWGLHVPHLMILVPNLSSLDGISTDRNNGGPYVMYAGTPYAHIMAPITAPSMTTRSVK